MSPEVAVRVTFVQSGGVVGAVRGCVLDTDALRPADADELTALVRASGLATSGDQLSADGRDLRVYEIRVHDGAGDLVVRFDDATLPETARPLVSFLRRNAAPRSPE